MPRLLAWAIAVSLFSLFSTEAAAQGPTETPSSIYSTRWATDLPITGLALTVTSLAYALDTRLITPRCPCPLTELNSLDRGVVGNRSDGALLMTDITLTAAAIAPLLVEFGYLGASRAFVEDALVYTQVLAVTGALVSITKAIVQRPVPRTYAGDPGYINQPGGYRSFYSGHVAMTTAALSAAAMTLHYRFSDSSKWPWFVVGGVGTLVAAGRIAGGVHFYSDVLVGAAAGTLAGIAIPWLHRRGNTASSFLILPQGDGALALWSRSF